MKPTDSEVAELAARPSTDHGQPLYYAQVIEAVPTAAAGVTRDFCRLHADEKLWQERRPHLRARSRLAGSAVRK